MEKENRKYNMPGLSVLRSSLFWDTDIDKIDWENQYKAIIRRVFERGNEQEKQELILFYGKGKIQATLNAPKTQPPTLQTKPDKI